MLKIICTVLFLSSTLYGDNIKATFDQWEIDRIEAAITRNYPDGLPESSLRTVLYTVRKTENGRVNHLAFGIINPKCPASDYDAQAGWAICTIVKNYHRWVNGGKKGSFIEFLGNRYAPKGVANDPKGLNKNWIKNAKHWFAKLSQ
jgi:hypothetical protein